MFSDLTVIVKDSEKKLTKKFPIYASYSIHEDDPVIRECVQQTIKEFGDQPEDVSVKINLEIQ